MPGVVCDVFIAAEPFEPVHARFATEPCELALGVVAMALLGLGNSLFAGKFVFEDGGGFGVSQRGEGPAVFAIAGDKAFGFFDEATVEHSDGALVDTLVEILAWWIETEAEDAVADQGVAALLPPDCHRSTAAGAKRFVRRERDFDGADDFGDVVDMDSGRGSRVEASEEPVQMCGAAGC